MILIILYLIANILLFNYVYNNIVKKGWTAFSYLSVFIIIFYFIPGFLLSFTSYFNIDINILYLNDIKDITVDLFVLLLIIISFLLYVQGVKSNKKINFLNKNRVVKSFNKEMYLLTIISFASLMNYISGFGSIEDAFFQAKFIRSGYYLQQMHDNSTSHTFYFRFIFLALIPFFYFLYHKNISKFKALFFCIINLFTLIILYFFLADGRQNIIDFFIIIILTHIIIKNKQTDLYTIIPILITVILFIPFLSNFFGNAAEENHFIESYLNEFGFAYLSLKSAVFFNKDYLYFSDFLYYIYGHILPTSWGDEQKTSNYLNSMLVIGRDVKSIPPGFLAQGYYSLGLIGLMVISYLTGKLTGLLDMFFINFLKKNKWLTFIYVFFFVKMMSWIRTGLPHNFFYDFSIMILFLLFIYLLKYKSIKLNE